ncbi:methyl-accepting chemotaxis protein [Niveispirillum sp. KHB5.9]|uniref:methyl-accepting chemotaxis protein n=1 Tax=Niveispirillum sp. KHB5.9 TaxID=3400269 RepID=UPI003A835B44
MNSQIAAQDAHSRRLAVFQITEADLALVRELKGFAQTRLPGLLEQWHSRFAAWPEIQKALSNPMVHEVRVDHWRRAVSAQLDDQFMVSAKRLAQAFYENDVPGYAVAICHSTVMNGIFEALELTQNKTGVALLLDRGEVARKSALREALSKLAWLDLELLLETYAEAERANRTQALIEMADTVEREASAAVEKVASQTGGMARDAEGMAGSAERVGVNAQDVASSARQALTNAQTVASATEQLAGSIQEITSQVTHSSTVTRRAVETGERASSTIRSLSETVGRIGEVAQMIAGIAGQTNLLALNATIEAARAGDAGKGFAVVASEVKQLANQTARSTEEIARQIAEIQSVTASAVAAMSEIGSAISEIDHVSTAIAAAIEEQSAATQEISRNVVATSSAVSDVASNIAVVSGEATRTGEQAAQVKNGSADVATSIEELRRVLVRVVRTSTEEANRRRKPRYKVDESCTLDIRGRATQARLINISAGGAMVMADGVDVAPGTVTTLSVSRHGMTARATVLKYEQGTLHLKFDKAETGADAFRNAFAALTRGRQEAA